MNNRWCLGEFETKHFSVPRLWWFTGFSFCLGHKRGPPKNWLPHLNGTIKCSAFAWFWAIHVAICFRCPFLGSIPYNIIRAEFPQLIAGHLFCPHFPHLPCEMLIQPVIPRFPSLPLPDNIPGPRLTSWRVLLFHWGMWVCPACLRWCLWLTARPGSC